MGGGTLGENTQTLTDAKYSADQRARQYKREKLTPYGEDLQGKAGELTGGAYRTIEQIPNALADAGREINKGMQAIGLMGGGGTDAQVPNDTSEANYSTSSRTQTSSGSGKKADLSDTDNKTTRGASANLTVRNKKKKSGNK
jgi:hypothetical protein|tara:strand:- start:54 stop:479 length:426 start_codon:yes stop_codon:yes gene_type:complete